MLWSSVWCSTADLAKPCKNFQRIKLLSPTQIKMKGRKWLVKSSFEGPVTRENFEIVEEELVPIKDGGKLATYHLIGGHYHRLLEFLLEALWISVDPYMKYVK